MRDLYAIARITAVSLVLSLGLTACGPASPDHPGHGVIKSVDTAARTVTVDHEDIPGFMKAMTMTFHLAPDVALGAIAPGSEVDLTVREEGGIYTVTAIRRTGS